MEDDEIIEQAFHLLGILKSRKDARKKRTQAQVRPEPVAEGAERPVFRLGQNANIPHMPKPKPIENIKAQQPLDYDAQQRERAQRVTDKPLTEDSIDRLTLKPVRPKASVYPEGSLEHTVLKFIEKKPGQTTQELYRRFENQFNNSAVYNALRDLKAANLLRTQGKRPFVWFAK